MSEVLERSARAGTAVGRRVRFIYNFVRDCPNEGTGEIVEASFDGTYNKLTNEEYQRVSFRVRMDDTDQLVFATSACIVPVES